MAGVQDARTMKLIDWLEQHRISQVGMARKLGVSEATISRVCRGINTPGLDVAIKIQDFTGHQVGLADLIRRGRGEAAS
jgi:transcriptional regulator with XRE-family HTH domain